MAVQKDCHKKKKKQRKKEKKKIISTDKPQIITTGISSRVQSNWSPPFSSFKQSQGLTK